MRTLTNQPHEPRAKKGSHARGIISMMVSRMMGSFILACLITPPMNAFPHSQSVMIDPRSI